ncbi:MAG TPA: hypothetical protein VG759_05960 [Candidatus Angelobacter sp.]|nr:hypothetical protein [Candidatus Angelobacter sp.]
MPAKPVWYGKLDAVIAELQLRSRSFVDRDTVEVLLGVGRRRAQQIMAPCITDRVGASGIVERNALITRLQQIANGDEVHYERQRRRKVAQILTRLRQDRLEHPQLLVEAPVEVGKLEFKNLPAGVLIEPGRIIVSFDQPRQAIEKLLALAMAISNDFDGFERRVSTSPRGGTA